MAKEQRINRAADKVASNAKKPANGRKDLARKLDELEVGSGDDVRGGGNLGDI